MDLMMTTGTKTPDYEWFTGRQALDEMRDNPGVLYHSAALPEDVVAAFNGSEYVFIDGPGRTGIRARTRYAQFSSAMLAAPDWCVYGTETSLHLLSSRIQEAAKAAVTSPGAGPEYARGMLQAAAMVEAAGL